MVFYSSHLTIYLDSPFVMHIRPQLPRRRQRQKSRRSCHHRRHHEPDHRRWLCFWRHWRRSQRGCDRRDQEDLGSRHRTDRQCDCRGCSSQGCRRKCRFWCNFGGERDEEQLYSNRTKSNKWSCFACWSNSCYSRKWSSSRTRCYY